MTRRRIASVTGTRADYGLMRSVYAAVMKAPDLDLILLVTGMHLQPQFAAALHEIETDRLPIKVVQQRRSAGMGMAHAIGDQLIGIADELTEVEPDILLLQGDRGEMLAAAIAAAHLNIPIAHMSGGDRSGTIDDSVRAAVSKLAHVHLTTCADSSRNLIAMGEAPARIIEVGEPALDIIHDSAAAGEAELAALGIDTTRPYILATQHPVTTETSRAGEQMLTTLRALDEIGLPVLFTHPNTDTGGAVMTEVLEGWQDRPWLIIVPTLGTNRFLAALKHAAALVGNSSSGILEAASFKVPVVNIGTRQHGRLRPANVIDVNHDKEAIATAIHRAIGDPDFRKTLASCINPYGDGMAAPRTIDVLRRLRLDEATLAKWLPLGKPLLAESSP